MSIPTDLPLSAFLEATMNAAASQSAQFKQEKADAAFARIKHFNSKLDQLHAEPWKEDKNYIPSKREPPVIGDSSRWSILNKHAMIDEHLEVSIRRVNIDAIRLPPNVLFRGSGYVARGAKRVIPPPSGKKTMVSVAINTDPVRPPTPPECMRCLLQDRKKFMNRWTQTMRQTNTHDVSTQAGENAPYSSGFPQDRSYLDPLPSYLREQRRDDGRDWRSQTRQQSHSPPRYPPNTPPVYMRYSPDRNHPPPDNNSWGDNRWGGGRPNY